MKRKINLKLFSYPDPAAASGEPDQTSAGPTIPQNSPSSVSSSTALAIDYDKIAQIVAGKQNATEDSILKGYFKQQGLSQEEVNQAIATFKQQKAASQPDVAAITQQAQAAQETAKKAQIQAAATIAAVSLGIDSKTIPYLLKMADLSQVMGQDGAINDETLKSVLNKVMEDVPALKPQATGSAGFVQVGAASTGQQNTNESLTLKDAISAALKK